MGLVLFSNLFIQGHSLPFGHVGSPSVINFAVLWTNKLETNASRLAFIATIIKKPRTSIFRAMWNFNHYDEMFSSYFISKSFALNTFSPQLDLSRFLHAADNISGGGHTGMFFADLYWDGRLVMISTTRHHWGNTVAE